MKVAFPTDEHFPFQDDQARELAMIIVQDFDPDLLITGSDGLDFYSLSSFDKDPARMKINLQKEIDMWMAGQREWRDAAPNAKRRFIPGNHEDRLRRYLWSHPEIGGLTALRLDKLLDFEGLEIEWDEREYIHNEIVLFDRLVIRHGRFVRNFSGMSAKAELEVDRYGLSVMTGHTHRGGTVYAQTRNGVVVGQECFCLCRLDPGYLPRPNWQQGIVLAEVGEDYLSIEAIPFDWQDSFQRRKVARWRGVEYRV